MQPKKMLGRILVTNIRVSHLVAQVPHVEGKVITYLMARNKSYKKIGIKRIQDKTLNPNTRKNYVQIEVKFF